MNFIKLGDIFKISSGGTPSKNNTEYYNNGNIPWIKTGDLKNKYIKDGYDYITELGLEKSSAKLFPKDTVLIAMYGATIGATSILSFEATTNQACAAFLPNNKVLPEYLYYFFRFNKDKIISLGVGGAQPNISAAILKEILFPLINLEMQKQIVDIIDLAQELINKRKAQIEALDELIKSRFIEMFGDPINNPKKFELLTVNDVVDFQGGSQPDKKYFEYKKTDKNIRLIQIRDYKTDAYITYIPKDMAKRYCDVDDIMIGRYGPPIFQILKGIEGSYNVALLKATPKKGNREFIRYFLKQECLFKYLDSLSQRTAGQSGIDMPKLKKYPFPYPPIELQNKFEDFVKQVDKLKFKMENSLKELEDNFNSLMQKAFKGELFN